MNKQNEKSYLDSRVKLNAIIAAAVAEALAIYYDDEEEQTLESQIILKALKDSKYRKRLIANPTKLIAEEFGKELPAGVTFKVIEETANTCYLVLPYVAAVEAKKLSDADLLQAGPFRSWFRPCPCRCSSLSVCGKEK
jgi:hypothetical protein